MPSSILNLSPFVEKVKYSVQARPSCVADIKHYGLVMLTFNAAVHSLLISPALQHASHGIASYSAQAKLLCAGPTSHQLRTMHDTGLLDSYRMQGSFAQGLHLASSVPCIARHCLGMVIIKAAVRRLFITPALQHASHSVA